MSELHFNSDSLRSLDITPHWLLRLLGAQRVSIDDSSVALRLVRGDGATSVIHSVSLINGQGVQQGWLFSSLTLNTDDGPITVRGLKKSTANQLYRGLQRYFYLKVAPRVKQLAMSIQQNIDHGYLRISRWKLIQQRAQDLVNHFHFPPEKGLVTNEQRQYFIYVYDLASLDPKDLANLRQVYVSQQKAQFAEFFDRVESNPLTDKQRDACVIDEDNNLVLAGAGTGKTSVMVGRVGYLINSDQAKPHEVLMLAFANKAAQEIQERLASKLDVKGVTARTFHSLGKHIIAAVEGSQPSISRFAEDGKALSKQVDLWFDELLETNSYRRKVIKYFDKYLYPEKNAFDFNSEGEYFDYLQTNQIRTLKGDAVKSFEECLIANYLFKMGIEYQYEADYEINTRTLDYRQYKPDFYLTDYKIYLEHYGVDKEGNTAPYVNREEYWAGILWKRQLHQENQTSLIETFHFEHSEGKLLSRLEKKLTEAGVKLNPLPDESVLATLKEFGSVNQFSTLLTELLSLYKANWLDAQALERKLTDVELQEQVNAALELLMPILEKYQAELDQKAEIDFNDMIGKAIDYVQSGRFKSPWRYILVDEFQDISEARARLVKLLRDQMQGCSLFCVGDDWQAIYRFTGSDISFTTQFECIFGPTAITNLDKTFRFNNSISDVASKFVTQNPSQIVKQITTHAQIDSKAVSLYWQQAHRNAVDGVVQVLQQISEKVEVEASVYLLARFSFHLPDRQTIFRLNQQFPTLKLTRMTVHASKGKEADYVIVMGLEIGEFGFPSEKITHPLLDALLPKSEGYDFAEERRLFYVAMTRAKHKVYLLADILRPSRFVTELLKNNYPIAKDEFGYAAEELFASQVHCAQCQTGTMTRREGRNGLFYGCSHYPLCTHTEAICPQCAGVMGHEENYRVCINPKCDGWVPVCPDCGADLKLRSGRYGKFWGCTNYQSGDAVSCSYTQKRIEAPASKQTQH